MDDWTYCLNTLPKVSRTFALNIKALKGELHRSVLLAYLFCRTIDTIEDAAELDPKIKIRLLLEFSRLLEDGAYRKESLEEWIRACARVDGSANDVELLSQARRIFNVFDSLLNSHREQIIGPVSTMARGMAYFQSRADAAGGIIPIKDLDELEDYCYFVAGAVGEMLCGLFLEEMPGISEAGRRTMKENAVSFGLGLQMTNISKDVVADRARGWSYIPQSVIAERGLTLEEFHSGASLEKNLQILEKLLRKTLGHLRDALNFTLAIPRNHLSIRIFCVWPLWMAMETVAVLHNNKALLNSDDPVKISRQTVKRIVRSTPLFSFSNFLLTRSFDNILRGKGLADPPNFNLGALKERLGKISSNPLSTNTQTTA